LLAVLLCRFPPENIPPGVIPSEDMGSVTSPLTLVEWFMNYHARCDQAVDKHIEFIAEAGDLVFVPTGWWHLVLNVEDSIAITQNYVSEANLSQVHRHPSTFADTQSHTHIHKQTKKDMHKTTVCTSPAHSLV
jgi:ribosomal protein L16 Arg81 hydroxylase